MIPPALEPYAQFVNHNDSKQPVDALTGSLIDQCNPANHLTAEEALQRAATHNLTVAFVLTPNDPFFFLDLDHCIKDGQWSELSTSLYHYFSGCYFEISPSQTGAHIIGTLSTRPEHACKNIPEYLEFYTKNHSVTLTGYQAEGDAAANADTQTQWLIENYFPPNPATQSADWTDGPCTEWNGLKDDTALIEKMLKSKSASAVFGKGASFADLWNRNVNVLSIQYPHEANDFDLSSADAALVSHLTFWTGKDCIRIERLFFFSGLIRDKWAKREDYRRRTILNACSRCQSVYGQGVEAAPPVTVQDGAAALQGVIEPRTAVFQFLPPDQQIKHFAKCFYVGDADKILIPNGRLLNQSRFNSTYGGYVFALDSIGEKTTPEAWKVFTNSQAFDFPKVDHTGFYPKEAPGAILSDNLGHRSVNTYIPSIVPSIPGNVDRFTTHLAKLIPDQGDREILIAYMAAVVQHIGTKFFWCPLIQGTEGNGKSLIASCMKQAIGKKYTHEPRAKEIGEKYNSWMENKLLIVVEEINVSGKFELMDVLKILITGEELEIRAMNTDQHMVDVCTNFIMFSNFKDAVIKTSDNRRNAIFYTAQQRKQDITRDGMSGDYFPSLYRWLKKEGGYAHVTNFLQNYPIPPHLNPATECHRAPETTSTEEAIKFSRSKAEQAMWMAIDEQQIGFMGGWMSSIQITNLLERKRINDNSNRRGEILNNLGYVKHPGLTNGRSSGKNPVDNGRTTLYVTLDHPTIGLTDGKQILTEYLKAQGIGEPS